jgi:hypothetical protein
MSVPFWTAEKDRQLRRLEAKGLTARQIGEQIGTSRNAVIGRSARLRGLVFPCQIRREKEDQARRRERLQQRKQRNDAALAVMHRAMAKGVERDAAIVAAVQARGTYQAVGDELGLTRQRVQQIIALRLGRRRR